MRIVAGSLKGKSLAVPAGNDVRPTGALARESLFNVLGHGRFAAEGDPLAGATVLDAFAGSGANGLEALSRGAARATFLENHRAALDALKHNVRALGLESQVRVRHADALHPPQAEGGCDLVFLDPPYRQDLGAPALAALRARGWLAPGALIAVEMGKSDSFAAPEGFAHLDARTYGKTRIVFLRHEAGAATGAKRA